MPTDETPAPDVPSSWWNWWELDPRETQNDGSPAVPEAISREYWSPWDKMTIAGYEVPGHVVVFARKTKNYDIRTAVGQNGAIITHLGYNPVELDITITLWTPAQLGSYMELIEVVMPKVLPPSAVPPSDPRSATASATPSSLLPVINPALNMMHITDIYVHEVGILVPGPQPQSKVAIWRASEIPPLPMLTPPSKVHQSYESGLQGSPPRPAASQTAPPPSSTATSP